MKKKFNLFTWLLDKRELSLTLLILILGVVLSDDGNLLYGKQHFQHL